MSLPEVGADPAALLEVAAGIARQVVGQAIWHGERCNWVGAKPEEGAGGRVVMTYAALGPDLYGGSSGIALFLAHVAAVTGDRDAERTALGATRHALGRAPEMAGAPSVYSGHLGVALVATEVGRLLGRGELHEDAADLVAKGPGGAADGEFDLLLGSAGAVVGLLVLHRILGDDRLLTRATDVGDDLVRRARRSGGRLSWASRAIPGSRHLTGFSHGAAGAGYALAELAHATGRSTYRDAAEGAFAYEAHVYDPGQRNWPDFRSATGRGAARARPSSFATFWCHGAAGIALSRLRAYELSGADVRKQEAAVALETTRGSVLSALRAGGGNFSLCHGLAGNAEVVLEGARVLSPEDGSAVDQVGQVAGVGIERHGRGSEPWPCGARGGTTPALFLGLAGIGMFYLRLARPAVPSVLLLRPERFGAGTAPDAAAADELSWSSPSAGERPWTPSSRSGRSGTSRTRG